jgi:integrase
MPYKHRDAWHRQMRDYLKEVGQTSNRDTVTKYRGYLEESGQLLGFPDPSMVKVQEIRSCESRLRGRENTVCVKAHVLKTFLKWTGNRDAAKWRISHKLRPKVDGVFLSEEQVAYVRAIARSMSMEHELTFSLAVDMGLRCIDMSRLTLANAEEWERSRMSCILGKGRNGGKRADQGLSLITLPLLTMYLERRRELVAKHAESDHLLLFEHRNRLHWMTAKHIGKLMAQLSEQSGIRFRAHDGRRTCGHRMHRAGVPIETVAKVLRHETIDQAFKCYIGIQWDETLNALDRLQPCPEPLSQLVKR